MSKKDDFGFEELLDMIQAGTHGIHRLFDSFGGSILKSFSSLKDIGKQAKEMFQQNSFENISPQQTSSTKSSEVNPSFENIRQNPYHDLKVPVNENIQLPKQNSFSEFQFLNKHLQDFHSKAQNLTNQFNSLTKETILAQKPLQKYGDFSQNLLSYSQELQNRMKGFGGTFQQVSHAPNTIQAPSIYKPAIDMSYSQTGRQFGYGLGIRPPQVEEPSFKRATPSSFNQEFSKMAESLGNKLSSSQYFPRFPVQYKSETGIRNLQDSLNLIPKREYVSPENRLVSSSFRDIQRHISGLGKLSNIVKASGAVNNYERGYSSPSSYDSSFYKQSREYGRAFLRENIPSLPQTNLSYAETARHFGKGIGIYREEDSSFKYQKLWQQSTPSNSFENIGERIKRRINLDTIYFPDSSPSKPIYSSEAFSGFNSKKDLLNFSRIINKPLTPEKPLTSLEETLSQLGQSLSQSIDWKQNAQILGEKARNAKFFTPIKEKTYLPSFFEYETGITNNSLAGKLEALKFSFSPEGKNIETPTEAPEYFKALHEKSKNFHPAIRDALSKSTIPTLQYLRDSSAIFEEFAINSYARNTLIAETAPNDKVRKLLEPSITRQQHLKSTELTARTQENIESFVSAFQSTGKDYYNQISFAGEISRGFNSVKTETMGRFMQEVSESMMNFDNITTGRTKKTELVTSLRDKVNASGLQVVQDVASFSSDRELKEKFTSQGKQIEEQFFEAKGLRDKALESARKKVILEDPISEERSAKAKEQAEYMKEKMSPEDFKRYKSASQEDKHEQHLKVAEIYDNETQVFQQKYEAKSKEMLSTLNSTISGIKEELKSDKIEPSKRKLLKDELASFEKMERGLQYAENPESMTRMDRFKYGPLENIKSAAESFTHMNMANFQMVMTLGMSAPFFQTLTEVPQRATREVYDPIFQGVGGLTGLTPVYKEFQSFALEAPNILSSIQAQENTIHSLLGSKSISKSVIAKAVDISRTQPVQFNEAMEIMTALSVYPETRMSAQKSDFQKTAFDTVQLLSMLAPEQGTGGALFAVREALGGQWRSLQRRFNISPDLIASYSGMNLEEFKALPGDQLMKQMGKSLINIFNGEEVLTRKGGQLDVQLRNIGDTLTQSIILPLLDSNNLESNNFISSLLGNKDSYQNFDKSLLGSALPESQIKSIESVVAEKSLLQFGESLDNTVPRLKQFEKVLSESDNEGKNRLNSLFGQNLQSMMTEMYGSGAGKVSLIATAINTSLGKVVESFDISSGLSNVLSKFSGDLLKEGGLLPTFNDKFSKSLTGEEKIQASTEFFEGITQSITQGVNTISKNLTSGGGGDFLKKASDAIREVIMGAFRPVAEGILTQTVKTAIQMPGMLIGGTAESFAKGLVDPNNTPQSINALYDLGQASLGLMTLGTVNKTFTNKINPLVGGNSILQYSLMQRGLSQMQEGDEMGGLYNFLGAGALAFGGNMMSGAYKYFKGKIPLSSANSKFLGGFFKNTGTVTSNSGFLRTAMSGRTPQLLIAGAGAYGGYKVNEGIKNAIVDKEKQGYVSTGGHWLASGLMMAGAGMMMVPGAQLMGAGLMGASLVVGGLSSAIDRTDFVTWGDRGKVDEEVKNNFENYKFSTFKSPRIQQEDNSFKNINRFYDTYGLNDKIDQIELDKIKEDYISYKTADDKAKEKVFDKVSKEEQEVFGGVKGLDNFNKNIMERVSNAISSPSDFFEKKDGKFTGGTKRLQKSIKEAVERAFIDSGKDIEGNKTSIEALTNSIVETMTTSLNNKENLGKAVGENRVFQQVALGEVYNREIYQDIKAKPLQKIETFDDLENSKLKVQAHIQQGQQLFNSSAGAGTGLLKFGLQNGFISPSDYMSGMEQMGANLYALSNQVRPDQMLASIKNNPDAREALILFSLKKGIPYTKTMKDMFNKPTDNFLGKLNEEVGTQTEKDIDFHGDSIEKEAEKKSLKKYDFFKYSKVTKDGRYFEEDGEGYLKKQYFYSTEMKNDIPLAYYDPKYFKEGQKGFDKFWEKIESDTDFNKENLKTSSLTVELPLNEKMKENLKTSPLTNKLSFDKEMKNYISTNYNKFMQSQSIPPLKEVLSPLMSDEERRKNYLLKDEELKDFDKKNKFRKFHIQDGYSFYNTKEKNFEERKKLVEERDSYSTNFPETSSPSKNFKTSTLNSPATNLPPVNLFSFEDGNNKIQQGLYERDNKEFESLAFDAGLVMYNNQGDIVKDYSKPPVSSSFDFSSKEEKGGESTNLMSLLGGGEGGISNMVISTANMQSNTVSITASAIYIGGSA